MILLLAEYLEQQTRNLSRCYTTTTRRPVIRPPNSTATAMPRKFIRRYLPDHKRIRETRCLKLFGTLLHDPNLWHLNRRSVAGGAAVAMFCAFMPVPSQMALAAAVAIAVRVNLPLAVAGVWITNPVTIPPMFYFAYRVGAFLMGCDTSRPFHLELSLQWLRQELAEVWQPLLLGCFVVGTISALVAYFAVRGLWRLHVVRTWDKRRLRGKAGATDTGGPAAIAAEPDAKPQVKASRGGS
jgi:uncharacterized protein (DUF2062 family)